MCHWTFVDFLDLPYHIKTCKYYLPTPIYKVIQLKYQSPVLPNKL